MEFEWLFDMRCSKGAWFEIRLSFCGLAYYSLVGEVNSGPFCWILAALSCARKMGGHLAVYLIK